MPTFDKTAIIAEWEPYVGRVLCKVDYSWKDSSYYSGSAVALKWGNNANMLVTNKHVLTDEYGYPAAFCGVYFPSGKSLYSSSFYQSTLGIDLGFIELDDDGSNYMNDLTDPVPTFCNQSEMKVGDEIVILGYPSVGSQSSITVTEGIISSFEGDHIITSAKIEHGNSGGAAISLKNSCYLGVPTYSVTGSVESLARILAVWSFY